MFHPLTWISPVFAGSFTIPLGTARIERDRSGIQAKRDLRAGPDLAPAFATPGPPAARAMAAPLPDGASSHASSMSRVYVAERYVSNKDNNAASIRGLPLALPPLPRAPRVAYLIRRLASFFYRTVNARVKGYPRR
jgi:hypothetical protein